MSKHAMSIVLSTLLVAIIQFPLPSFAQTEVSVYRWSTGKFYIADTSNFSWTSWQSKAGTLFGGELASLTDAAENTWVQLNMRHTDGTYLMSEAWMGLNDAATEGTYVWEDSSTYSYTSWDSGEPNDGGGGLSEDYLIFRWYAGGKWNDYINDPDFGALIECPLSAPNNSVCDQLNDGGAPTCNTRSLLLQNASFSTNQTFKRGGFIKAGNNVDFETPTGDFDITGGDTLMWAEDYVQFDPGFSVSSGGALEVQVSNTQCN